MLHHTDRFDGMPAESVKIGGNLDVHILGYRPALFAGCDIP
jgi:hypothetical protein